jgi:hypothetical protein
MTESAGLRHQAWRLRQLARSVDHPALVVEFEAMAQDLERQAADIEKLTSRGAAPYWLAAGSALLLLFAVLRLTTETNLGIYLAIAVAGALAIFVPSVAKGRRGARGEQAPGLSTRSAMPWRRRAF